MSRKLPLKHLSIRIPWHDSFWNGVVCENPKKNAHCLVLKRIREERDDEKEASVSGKKISDLKQDQLPPCVHERGSFMAPFEFTRFIKHPYTETSDLHSHFKPTPFRHPSYSAAAVPYRFMLKDEAWEISDKLNLACDPEWEPNIPFSTSWVQGHKNQKILLEAFFESVHPNKSLCIFYAKQIPLVEDNRRVVIGVGRILHIGKPIEYQYDRKESIRGYIWDVAVQHSIRPDFVDGFLLPYHEILEKYQNDQTLNLIEYTAFAPEGFHHEFSYGTEHVSNDGAIGTLLSCAIALKKTSKIIDRSFQNELTWIDARLSELWKLRGPFPGLGQVLCAFGIEYGNLIAYELFSQVGENEDPWFVVDQIFKNPSLLPDQLSSQIGKTLQAKWVNLPQDRKALLKLLSRFEISVDQATRFYIEEEREKARIKCTDGELLSNPYLLYELDRFSQDPISIYTIDRGLFPDPIVRERHPIPEPSAVNEIVDSRRVRALIIYILEKAALEGHTLLPLSDIIQVIRDLPIVPACSIDRDLLRVVEKEFASSIVLTQMKDNKRAYQLGRFQEIGNIIRNVIERRLKGKRHTFEGISASDWSKFLNEEFLKEGIDIEINEEEKSAREEKVAAIKELAETRFSVLVGPAGTGKTKFVISTLCNHLGNDEEILLLAPTGKARVKLQQATGIPAQTIAQFLLRYDRYDETTGVYKLSDQEKASTYTTVIVDEASMLTEEQLGALFDSLKGVRRIILVGDPRQLPPIRAGRPFVDIINRLLPQDIETMFPRVGSGYAELTIRRRQQGESREDIQLADWFSGRELGPGEDEIFNLIMKDTKLERLRFIQWENEEEIIDKLLNVLVEEIELMDISDNVKFELSLGGTRSSDYIYFNCGAASAAENWQILTPVKGHTYGVREINRLVQRNFRSNTLEFAISRKGRIPRPQGPEGIVYGDKVINVINNRRFRVYPKEKALNYVANGEIGIVIGKFKKRGEKWRGALPLRVEFSSQPGFIYDFTYGDFKEEANPILELAYAITVHKAQGSDFEKSILIIPNPCRLLSRELLYTALTRQRERIIILHQGSRKELKKYSSHYYSETARRYTNLFQIPELVQIKDKLFENQLIHRTRNGELVRSKSEVIIADNLLSQGIEYVYEKKLATADGTERYPDFTIEDTESGVTYYWEHLGLLHEEGYRLRWERKLKWYESQKILPYEKGGGENGTLIITRDTEEGGIKSDLISKLITEIFSQ